jgi:hypothetical protein
MFGIVQEVKASLKIGLSRQRFVAADIIHGACTAIRAIQLKHYKSADNIGVPWREMCYPFRDEC